MKPTVPPVFAEKDLNYYLRMIRGDFGETEEEGQMAKSVSAAKQKNIVLVLNSQGLGQGKPELSQRLMKFFIQALVHNRVKPRALILLNEAVHLAAEGSPLINDLDVLVQQGVRVMVDVISAQTGVPNAQICCVGDRIYTDIAVAVNAGAQSVLVMSGETDEAILKASDVQPKYVLRDVAELAQILRGGATA